MIVPRNFRPGGGADPTRGAARRGAAREPGPMTGNESRRRSHRLALCQGVTVEQLVRAEPLPQCHAK
jgi:hypothetical protein